MSERERMRRIPVVRVADGGGAGERATDDVAVEAALEVRLNGDAFSVTMRTPGADRELAAGFLFTEGIVTALGDIVAVTVDPSADIVDVELSADRSAAVAVQRDARRQVTTTSSCGMCGRPDLASTRLTAPPIAPARAVDADVIRALPARIAPLQETFAATGGLHAAALCTLDGDIVDTAEDVGRHNAVDKIIGRQLLAGRLPLADALLFVSGRTSFEILQKAWLAGIPVVAAVSAPSSLAIDLALEAGITLIGFVRGGRFNIYSHPERITQAVVTHG
ncbi:MAG: formate dehydrogenase accessory sulfurtransferase FdhD [Vicinamibacteraceae bacterium]